MLRRQLLAPKLLGASLSRTFLVGSTLLSGKRQNSILASDIDAFCETNLGSDNIIQHSAVIKGQIAAKAAELKQLDDRWDAAMARGRSKTLLMGVGVCLFLAAQWAVLAHCVFITFDWNLVEPMTYFLGASFGWFAAAWYSLNGSDWTYQAFHEWMAERLATKAVMKSDPRFLERMKRLQEELASLEQAQNALYVADSTEKTIRL